MNPFGLVGILSGLCSGHLWHVGKYIGSIESIELPVYGSNSRRVENSIGSMESIELPVHRRYF